MEALLFTMYTAPFHRCVECNEVITNPLCSVCVAERMRIVVQEWDPALAETIQGAVIEGQTRCLSCGKGMGLCAHCFSWDIAQYIEERNPRLRQEFMSRFDFEVRKRWSS